MAIFLGMDDRNRRRKYAEIYFLVYRQISVRFLFRPRKLPYTSVLVSPLYLGIRLEIGPSYQSLPSRRRLRGRVALPQCSYSGGTGWIRTSVGETGRHPCIFPQGENLSDGELSNFTGSPHLTHHQVPTHPDMTQHKRWDKPNRTSS